MRRLAATAALFALTATASAEDFNPHAMIEAGTTLEAATPIVEAALGPIYATEVSGPLLRQVVVSDSLAMYFTIAYCDGIMIGYNVPVSPAVSDYIAEKAGPAPEPQVLDPITAIVWLPGDAALVWHRKDSPDEWIEAVYPLRAHQTAVWNQNCPGTP